LQPDLKIGRARFVGQYFGKRCFSTCHAAAVDRGVHYDPVKPRLEWTRLLVGPDLLYDFDKGVGDCVFSLKPVAKDSERGAQRLELMEANQDGQASDVSPLQGGYAFGLVSHI
jgi:hypothetical protein